MSLGRKSIKVNDVEMDIKDLDLKKLEKEQAKDIDEIEKLQKAIDELN